MDYFLLDAYHPSWILVLYLIGALGFVAVIRSAIKQRRKGHGSLFAGLPFPPGPKQYPVIGSLLAMPTKKEYVTFSQWKGIYGDIVGLKILGMNLLVLNSAEVVEDLLDKRGAKYSSRPPMTVLTKWGGFSWALPMLKYGDEMHMQRKMLFQFLNRSAIKAYHEPISKEAMKLTLRINERPEEFDKHVVLMSGSTILKIAYGFETKDAHDQWIVLNEKLVDIMRTMASAGAHPVDIFPSLSNLPPSLFGRKFARDMRQMNQITTDILHLPYKYARNEMALEKAQPSMVKSLVEENLQKDAVVKDESSIQASTAMAYAAGGDTTTSAVRTFILAMMMYPEAQRKAQKEIDLLLQGEERLPTLEDRERLPYVESVLRETLRWKPVTPLAVPHMSIEDDEYRGYFIPAGTYIFPNAWQCLHDEKDFPLPEEFNPERFTDGEVLYEHVPDPRDFAFGFGRRVCPGRHLAEGSLWINIALLLFTFNISKGLNESGSEIEPDLDYNTSAAISDAKPFKCRFDLRSKERLELVKATLQS